MNYPGQSVDDVILLANANPDEITLLNLELEGDDYNRVVAETEREIELRDFGTPVVSLLPGNTTVTSRVSRWLQVLLSKEAPEEPVEEPTDPSDNGSEGEAP